MKEGGGGGRGGSDAGRRMGGRKKINIWMENIQLEAKVKECVDGRVGRSRLLWYLWLPVGVEKKNVEK